MFRLFRPQPKQVLTCSKNKCTATKVHNCVEHCDKCTTLEDVEAGQCVCIRNYKGGCKKMRRRLLDLGLTPHAQVNVVRKAPFGDPILLQVGDCCLSLSSSEAAHLEVDPVDVPAHS